MSPAEDGGDHPTEPPPADPEVREALDQHEDELAAPEAEDAADRDEDEHVRPQQASPPPADRRFWNLKLRWVTNDRFQNGSPTVLVASPAVPRRAAEPERKGVRRGRDRSAVVRVRQSRSTVPGTRTNSSQSASAAPSRTADNVPTEATRQVAAILAAISAPKIVR